MMSDHPQLRTFCVPSICTCGRFHTRIPHLCGILRRLQRDGSVRCLHGLIFPSSRTCTLGTRRQFNGDPICICFRGFRRQQKTHILHRVYLICRRGLRTPEHGRFTICTRHSLSLVPSYDSSNIARRCLDTSPSIPSVTPARRFISVFQTWAEIRIARMQCLISPSHLASN